MFHQIQFLFPLLFFSWTTKKLFILGGIGVECGEERWMQQMKLVSGSEMLWYISRNSTRNNSLVKFDFFGWFISIWPNYLEHLYPSYFSVLMTIVIIWSSIIFIQNNERSAEFFLNVLISFENFLSVLSCREDIRKFSILWRKKGMLKTKRAQMDKGLSTCCCLFQFHSNIWKDKFNSAQKYVT